MEQTERGSGVRVRSIGDEETRVGRRATVSRPQSDLMELMDLMELTGDALSAQAGQT